MLWKDEKRVYIILQLLLCIVVAELNLDNEDASQLTCAFHDTLSMRELTALGGVGV